MAFYLRKAFKSGPVRFNLSKSGIGLSGGITGARVGLSPRGVYVHGGRHGLYYRKYAKKGSRPSKSSKPFDSFSEHQHSGPVSLFINTGVTIPSKTSELRKSNRISPSFPSAQIVNAPVRVALIAAAILLIISVSDSFSVFQLPSLLFLSAMLIWLGSSLYWKRQASQLLENIIQRVESDYVLPLVKEYIPASMPNRWKLWLSSSIHAVLSEMAVRQEEIDTVKTLGDLDEQLPISTALRDDIRADIVAGILDEMLEDYELSEPEEENVRTMISYFSLPESSVINEMHRIEHFALLRNRMNSPLQQVKIDVDLTRGELAYEEIEQVRVLNERIIRRYQRNNVQYREIGYEIDFEGKAIITNKRIIILNRGTKEYRLNRIMDVTADPESAIIELTLSNRKSPVILSVDEPLLMAARLSLVRNLD